MNNKYSELINTAFKLHSQNRLDEAEKIYQQLIEISSDDVNLLNLYGVLCLSKGKTKQAIELLSKAVILKESAYIISNLAKAYLYNGESENAVKLFNKALEYEKNDDIYYSLGIAYKAIGNLDNAILAYKSALKIKPDKFNCAYNLFNIYKDLSRTDEAVELLEKFPENEEAMVGLSSLFEEKKEYKKAIEKLEKAVYINKNEPSYYYNLGVMYSYIESFEKAKNNYIRALKLKPDYVQALVNLCSISKKDNKEEALKYILKAYEISPNEENVVLNLAEIYKNLGQNSKSIDILTKFISNKNDSADVYSLLAQNYMDLENYEKALNYYLEALKIKPSDLNYMHGKAMALKYLGDTKSAYKILEYIVKKDPNLIQSSISLGMLYLTDKNFQKGMPLYIKRSTETNFSKLYKKNIWQQGCILKDKTILLYSDCGLGDTIMFSRYIPFLQKIAKKVILQTDREIIDILSQSFKDVDVIPKNKTKQDYDIVIPLMSLPLALNIDFDNIPYSNGYLKFNKEKCENFSKLDIFKTLKPKIGIVTEGNKRILKNRAIPIEFIEQLTENNNYKFYSFQLNETKIKNTQPLKEYIKNYDDTASLLKNTDILITIDSSIVHIAGALGVKTFLMLPNVAEWRWFKDNNTTPWYDSVKIFRQTSNSNWQEVVNSIKAELDNYVHK